MMGGAVLALFSALALLHSTSQFSVQPTQLFVGQDSSVLLTMRPTCTPGTCPERSDVLMRKDGIVRYRWQLADDGKMGDAVAGDGVYSHQAQFKQRFPGTLLFEAADGQTASITVVTRPTFFEIVTKMWNRWMEALQK